MKLKYKMLIDTLMAIALFIVLKYNFTGGLLHEIIGFVLIAVFLIHIICNRKYVKAIGKILKARNNCGKNIFKLIVNIVLFICMIVMLVTSVGISKDLLGFLNIELGDFMVLRTIHVICAYTMVMCVFGHVTLHLDMIVQFVRKFIHVSAGEMALRISSRVVAFALAIFVLKSSVENVTSSINMLKSTYAYSKTYVSEYTVGSTKETETISEAAQEETITESISQTTTEDTTKESLNDYLSKLFCTGCNKHCSLLAPQCSKGITKQKTAMAEYNAM